MPKNGNKDAGNRYEEYDDDDFTPTIGENANAEIGASDAARARGDSTPSAYEDFDPDDEDVAPTIMEGATFDPSTKVDPAKSAPASSANKHEDPDPGEEDCAPTIMEGATFDPSTKVDPAKSAPASSVNKYDDFDPDDEDFTPTISENATSETTKKSAPPANAYEEYDPDDEDFAPTIMETPGAGTEAGDRTTASQFANNYAELDGDEDFAPTIVEGAGQRAGPSAPSPADKFDEAATGDFDVTVGDVPSSSSFPSETKTPSSTDTRTPTGMTTTSISSIIRRTFGGQQAAGDSGMTGGAAIEKYEIGAEIAKGGMGAILSARDQNIRRHVAMKVLLQNREVTQNTVFRFIEEAQVTGQIEHPNIVPVYELGVNAEGGVFYTMKLVKGVTLKEIIKGIRTGDQEMIDQYPLSRLLIIFQKVCDAMAFAHSKGIIHRDLKPENIMVGDFGEVQVMDWGLGKVLEDDAESHGISTVRLDLDSSSSSSARTESGIADDAPAVEGNASATKVVESYFIEDDVESLKTMDGAIMGTPNFMAPEQASGHNDKIKRCSDIYALGGMLYNILTLRVPISGKSFTEMMVNIVRGNIKPPVEFNPQSRYKKKKDEKLEDKKGTGKGKKSDKVYTFHHCPGARIPEALSAVCMKALSVKVDDRYPDVRSLQDDIEAYQGGFATSAEEADMLKLIILMIKRHKALFAVITAFTVVGLVFGVLSIREIQNEKRIADEQRIIAEGQKEEADIQRESAETAKVEADHQRIAAESAKEDADKQRVNAEAARMIAESEKEKAEEARQVAEAARKRVLEQKEEIQKTLDQLVEEKKRTEAERMAKEQEKLARVAETQKRQEVEKASAPEFVKKAEALSAESKWAEAIAAAEMAIELDSSISDAWLLRGRLHFGNLEFEEGIGALLRTKDVDVEGLKDVGRKYYDILFRQGTLSANELRSLSDKLKEMGDLILSDRLYKLALEEDKKVLSRFSTIRYEVKKANIELNEINFQYTISDADITLDLSKNRNLVNIKPLEGLPITNLNLSFTDVYDIRNLIGMPLRVLHLPFGRISTRQVFKGMPLEELHIHGKPEEDFSFITSFPNATVHIHLYGWEDATDYKLEFMKHVPLNQTRLHLHGQEFDDLEFFAGVPLQELVLVETGITDLSPIRYLEIEYLDINYSYIKNFKTLAELPLKHLILDGTMVKDKDLLYLKGRELEYLSLENTEVKNIDILQGMPLENLNISGTQVIDFSVLAGLPLKDLRINKLPVIELRFLDGMKLEVLHMADTYVNDIRILADMPLRELDIGGTKIIEINVLERKPLAYLSIRDTLVSNLEVVKGMPLNHLNIANTPINNISFLSGMALNYFSMAKTEVSDIGVLRNMPLKMVSLEKCKRLITVEALKECVHLQRLIVPEHLENIRFLQKHLTLEFMAFEGDLDKLTQTTTQFWSQYDAKHKGQ